MVVKEGEIQDNIAQNNIKDNEIPKSKIVDIKHDDKKNEYNLSFTEEELQTIRKTVAKDANDAEFKMFISLARRYGLDPFNKELFFWKINDEPTIMTSRDGYLKIADRHPAYDGIVSDVVRIKDNFLRNIGDVKHEYGTDRGNIIGAYALVYRKDRKYPVYTFAPFNEYNANNKAWNQYPSAMILKVAESMSLKRAFTVSGLVSREEMQVQLQNDDFIPEDIQNDTDISDENRFNKEEITPVDSNLSEREEEIKEIIDDNAELKRELYEYLQWVKEERNLEKVSINDLEKTEFEELKDLLNKFKGFTSKTA